MPSQVASHNRYQCGIYHYQFFLTAAKTAVNSMTLCVCLWQLLTDSTRFYLFES